LTLSVYRAEADLWRVKGDVIDLRKTGFAPMSTSLQPAGLIHHMQLQLVVNPHTLELKSIEAQQPVVAVEPSERSCGECCRDPIDRLQALCGVSLDQQFASQLSAVFGGNKGCSHLLALFRFVAAAIPRVIELEQQQQQTMPGERAIDECIFQRSLAVDGFYCANKHIELTLEMGDYLMKPEVLLTAPVERLSRENNLRFYTRVQPDDLQMSTTCIAERERSWETLTTAVWQVRDDWAQAFCAMPIMPGFTGRVLAFCSDDTSKQLLQDGLLQLAPGYIQVVAAMADQWIASMREGNDDQAVKPMGGMADSCYIWRSDGPLMPKRREAVHDLKARGRGKT
jgi:hypothetical protein